MAETCDEARFIAFDDIFRFFEAFSILGLKRNNFLLPGIQGSL